MEELIKKAQKIKLLLSRAGRTNDAEKFFIIIKNGLCDLAEDKLKEDDKSTMTDILSRMLNAFENILTNVNSDIEVELKELCTCVNEAISLKEKLNIKSKVIKPNLGSSEKRLKETEALVEEQEALYSDSRDITKRQLTDCDKFGGKDGIYEKERIRQENIFKYIKKKREEVKVKYL